MEAGQSEPFTLTTPVVAQSIDPAAQNVSIQVIGFDPSDAKALQLRYGFRVRRLGEK